MSAGVGNKRPCVDCIQQFLVKKFFSGNIDDSEPIKFFFVGSFAEINGQFIVKESLLFILCESREIQCSTVRVFYVEAMSAKLANRQGALLTVNHLEVAVFADTPIHDVQRKTLQYGIDDCLLLFHIITKLALIRRSDVQLAAITLYAGVRIIGIAVDEVGYLD